MRNGSPAALHKAVIALVSVADRDSFSNWALEIMPAWYHVSFIYQNIFI